MRKFIPPTKQTTTILDDNEDGNCWLRSCHCLLPTRENEEEEEKYVDSKEIGVCVRKCLCCVFVQNSSAGKRVNTKYEILDVKYYIRYSHPFQLYVLKPFDL